MGIATSSNVAQIITDVSNSVINQASSNNSNFQTCQNSQKWTNCSVKNLNIKNICDIQAKAYSILTQNNTSDLNSTVSQKLLQTAQSQVGSMGIGYAAANNLVSALVKNSNLISNQLSNSSSTVMTVFNNFVCNGSSFGNVDIVNKSTENAMVQQVTGQTDVANLISSVSQDITQSATATVEGIAAFLIALAILIVAIGYVAFKPLGLVLSNKIIIGAVVSITLISVILFLYFKQLPPFFNPPLKCTQATAGPCCSTPGMTVQCVDIQQNQNTYISSPPLRYVLDIVGGDGSIPGSSPNTPSGLIQLVIVSAGGWTQAAYNNLQTSDIVVKYGFENPLTLDGMYYNTNVQGWTFTDDDKKLYARFVLCNALNIDTSTYIFDEEACMVNGVVISPADQTKGCMKFVPSIMPTPSVMDKGLNGNGMMVGEFGSCNNATYRLQNFMKYGGFLIPVAVFAGFIAFLIFYPGNKVTTE